MIVCLKFPEFLLSRVLKLGAEVILVRDAYDVLNEPLSDEVRTRLRAVYEVDRLDSIEEMSGVFVDLELKYPRAISSVLSGAEYGMFSAAYLRSALGLDPREPDLAITVRDKRWMKKAFSDAGIPCAPIISNYQPGDSVPKEMFPIVAKPAAGTGSFNTAILQTADDLDAFVSTEQLHPALASHQWAIEQKLEGDEYHVDMIWQGGEIVFTSVGRYMVPRLVALDKPSRNGSIILSPETHAELYRSFGELMTKFGVAKGLTSGVTHAEFFVDANGQPYISEVATRFAGGAVPEAINAAFGVDIIDAWLKVELGLEPDLTGCAEGYRLAGWLAVSPTKNGQIRAVPTKAEYLASEGVVDAAVKVAPGQDYRHDNPSNWCVLVTIAAPDEKSFMGRCDDLYARLPIQV